MRPTVDVLVVVVTYHSRDLVPALLAGIPDAVGPHLTHAVVVADNDSRDGTVAEVERAEPSATVVAMGRNAGYSAAINAAVEAGPPARSIAVLNPDMRLDPGSLAALHRALGDGIGITAPRLRDTDGRLAHSLRRRPTVLRALGEAVLGGSRSGRWPALGEVERRPEAYEQAHDVDWASGCALMIDAACAADVGAWDESFFLYAEEIDYCLRAADAGWRVRYVPDATAVHVGGESHDDPRLWTMSVLNKARLHARRTGRLRALAFRGALLLGEAIRSLTGSPVHRAAAAALVLPSRRPPELG